MAEGLTEQCGSLSANSKIAYWLFLIFGFRRLPITNRQPTITKERNLTGISFSYLFFTAKNICDQALLFSVFNLVHFYILLSLCWLHGCLNSLWSPLSYHHHLNILHQMSFIICFLKIFNYLYSKIIIRKLLVITNRVYFTYISSSKSNHYKIIIKQGLLFSFSHCMLGI